MLIQTFKRELRFQIEIIIWKVDYISSNMRHPLESAVRYVN